MNGRILLACWSLLAFGGAPSSLAAFREYTLDIDQKMINMTGRSVPAMTLNGSIPGPVLRFQEGDTARIHVRNNMPVETSIHWHGFLVPNEMDGVPYLTFPPIAPHTTFTYEFPIRQKGTYWYHSHTMLQEQSGLYGGIVITGRDEELDESADHVLVLSDWTDRNPHDVLRTLKRGSEWFSIEKKGAQSILGAARMGMTGAYFQRELQRMPPMDISDVAYDRFLANGRPEIEIEAKGGTTVRLRVIDGSAGTFFYLEYAGGPMKIVSADGQDVVPIEEKRILIGVAETYDVLLQVPAHGAYEFRATSQDGSGSASVWIGKGERHPADTVPHPNLYHAMGEVTLSQIFALTPAGAMGMPDKKVNAGEFDKPGSMMNMEMGDMGAMNDTASHAGHHGAKMKMDHSKMDSVPTASRPSLLLKNDIASAPSHAMDGMGPERPWPPYDQLRSPQSTAFSSTQPVREIRLTLDGDMERYVWKINNKTLFESDSIHIKKGEVVRFIMINRTMMHHPMHLHGHFFRVINKQGDHSPLKHTVDVPPMTTTVIEFDADELGDWFFHCHILYHMEAGMARIVHYETFTPSPDVQRVRSKLYHDPLYAWADADIFSNMTQGTAYLTNSNYVLSGQWEAGWERVNKTEWEGVGAIDRVINRFTRLFVGVNTMGESTKEDETRAVAGLTYLLPFNIHSRSWVDEDGGGRFILEKEFMLTPRIALDGETEYDTHEKWEERAGIHYLLTKGFSLLAQWHSDYGLGGGVQIRF